MKIAAAPIIIALALACLSLAAATHHFSASKSLWRNARPTFGLRTAAG
jgi:hypothetical protein